MLSQTGALKMQDKTLQAEVEKPMVFLKLEICFFGFFVFNGFWFLGLSLESQK